VIIASLSPLCGVQSLDPAEAGFMNHPVIDGVFASFNEGRAETTIEAANAVADTYVADPSARWRHLRIQPRGPDQLAGGAVARKSLGSGCASQQRL
jgi:hypothetical protein